jgi:hypothetical protein
MKTALPFRSKEENVKTEDMTKLDPVEKSRTYEFPNGNSVGFHMVTHIYVSNSGHHRLKTADNLLHIVAPGWMSITIDAEDWTL